MVMTNRVDFFHNNFRDFSYHGLNQQISISGTSVNDKIPGKNFGNTNFVD